MNKNIFAYDLEKILLRNMTFVILIIIWVIWILFFILDKKILDIKYALTSTWAIVAFWYWYKKYERDKELEVVEKYTEKYNTLVENLYKNRTRTNYRKLFNLYWEEFFLKSKWYISDELWEQWEYWIRSDLNREFKKE